MFDGAMRRLIDPPLDRLGRVMARTGIGANAISLIGLALGLAAAGAIAFGHYLPALLLILISRIADGLDGAIARATQTTDFGGYLDIAADFLFYGAVPLAFALASPGENGLAGAFLLASFYFNGTTFLGYALMADRRKMTTCGRGSKSLYFTGGLLEGTETIGFFCVLCLWPDLFTPLAFVFGALCYVTAISRMVLAWQVFGKSGA